MPTPLTQRVIKSESDDMVAAVQKNGVPVDYVVFPDEGHGVTKQKNNMEANRKIVHCNTLLCAESQSVRDRAWTDLPLN